MRDFDQERAERSTLDHTFKINGRELHFRRTVPPETFARVADLQAGTYRAHFPIPGTEQENNGEPLTVWRQPTEVEVVGLLDELFLEYLEEQSHGAWRLIRQDGEPSYLEMWSLIDYMTSVQMGRPTMPASNSGGGGGDQTNGTTSTAGSVSPAAASN